jgi:predicted MFS family arabinose efflux permease
MDAFLLVALAVIWTAALVGFMLYVVAYDFAKLPRRRRTNYSSALLMIGYFAILAYARHGGLLSERGFDVLVRATGAVGVASLVVTAFLHYFGRQRLPGQSRIRPWFFHPDPPRSEADIAEPS